MVDPDSDRVPRAPPYSGTASWSSVYFAYGAVTLFGRAVRHVLLFPDLFPPRVIPMRPYNPGTLRFGLLRVRSPLLAESLLISSPRLLRWFTSPGPAPPRYFIHARGARLAPCGLPHSGTPGSMDVCSSPGLFAACRALHRRSAPRHPPWTYISLDHIAFPPAHSIPLRSSRGAVPPGAFIFSVFSLPLSCQTSSRPPLAGRRSFMEIRGLEPLTLGLQSRCSSQLS